MQRINRDSISHDLTYRGYLASAEEVTAQILDLGRAMSEDEAHRVRYFTADKDQP